MGVVATIQARAVPSLSEGIRVHALIRDHDRRRPWLADVFVLAAQWHHFDAQTL